MVTPGNGNGVSRREFDALVRDVEKLEQGGSLPTQMLARDARDLERRLDAVESNFTWAVRGIVGIVFAVIVGIVLAASNGAFS